MSQKTAANGKTLSAIDETENHASADETENLSARNSRGPYGGAKGCDRSRYPNWHRGPFFSITVCANESGTGTRINGKDSRRQARRVVGRLCEKCLASCLIRCKGKSLARLLKAQSENAGNRD